MFFIFILILVNIFIIFVIVINAYCEKLVMKYKKIYILTWRTLDVFVGTLTHTPEIHSSVLTAGIANNKSF